MENGRRDTRNSMHKGLEADGAWPVQRIEQGLVAATERETGRP